MRIECNRYNSQKVIGVMRKIAQFGGPKTSMTLYARWQVSVVDSRGRHYDYYFAAKPTRKQIAKCVRG